MDVLIKDICNNSIILNNVVSIDYNVPMNRVFFSNGETCIYDILISNIKIISLKNETYRKSKM